LPQAGNAPATGAAGSLDTGYMGGPPVGAGPSDVSTPGHYADTGAMSFGAAPSTGYAMNTGAMNMGGLPADTSVGAFGGGVGYQGAGGGYRNPYDIYGGTNFGYG
jgi:hypothetical protein